MSELEHTFFEIGDLCQFYLNDDTGLDQPINDGEIETCGKSREDPNSIVLQNAKRLKRERPARNAISARQRSAPRNEHVCQQCASDQSVSDQSLVETSQSVADEVTNYLLWLTRQFRHGFLLFYHDNDLFVARMTQEWLQLPPGHIMPLERLERKVESGRKRLEAARFVLKRGFACGVVMVTRNERYHLLDLLDFLAGGTVVVARVEGIGMNQKQLGTFVASISRNPLIVAMTP